MDGGGVDVGVGLKIEVVQPLLAGEPCCLDPAFGAAALPVLALGHQQLGQEPAVGELLTVGGIGNGGELGAQGRQPQHPACLVDRGVSGGFGQPALMVECLADRLAGPVRGGERKHTPLT
jgi:hypothetical protein